MANDFVMPKLAMAMGEGTVNEWLAEEGAHIGKGHLIATIETEKVAYEIEAPHTGYFHIVTPVDVTVPCGTLIGQFADSEEELATLQQDAAAATEPSVETGQEPDASTPVPDTAIATSAPARQAGDRIAVSPLARKMAGDMNLDLFLINGTGPGGRIVKRDILAAAESGIGRAAPLHTGGSIEKARIPVRGTRKTIGDRMMQSLQTTAQLSSFWESDVTDLLAMRRKLVAREDKLGTRVSVNAFLVKAIIYGVRQVPIANACLEGNEIVIYDNINVGFAVSMPGQTEYDSSLLVPVLRNVENLGLVEIDQRMKALVTRVREDDFTEDDLTGATITLSTTAGIAPPGHRSTPVLNLPNAVLLGPSTSVEKPSVVDGQVVPRMLLPMSVTFDHRILDGDPAVRFMAAVHECLENPELLLA